MKTLPGLTLGLPDEERRLLEPPSGREEPDEPPELEDDEPIVELPEERIVGEPLPQLPEVRGRAA